jgi:hypothetical protein
MGCGKYRLERCEVYIMPVSAEEVLKYGVAGYGKSCGKWTFSGACISDGILNCQDKAGDGTYPAGNTHREWQTIKITGYAKKYEVKSKLSGIVH